MGFDFGYIQRILAEEPVDVPIFDQMILYANEREKFGKLSDSVKLSLGKQLKEYAEKERIIFG